jgi:uncharacterized membrane protein YkoI
MTRTSWRVLAVATLAAAPLAAQPIKGSGKLKAQAKISGDSAKKVALAQVPNGKIQSAEIEREKGKLIYSFDVKVAGKAGVEEVNVDALTGAVVGKEHESAAAERAEAKAERSATKKP